MIADDLFAGAGGWDLAAAELGIHARGVENMKEARATRDAAGLTTVHDDVWTFGEWLDAGLRSDDPAYYKAALQIASPPCQTFSAAGKGNGRKALDDVLRGIRDGYINDIEHLRFLGEEVGDPRTALVLTPLHYALTRSHYQHLAWEQVPTVLPVWEACAEALRAKGWNVWTGLLHSEQYGVPQTRKRAFLLASRRGPVAPPTPTHSRYYSRTPEKLDVGVQKWVSMAEGLGWGMTHAPSPCVTGSVGRGLAGGSNSRKTLHREREEGRWLLRNNSSANAAERTLDQPAPTLYFGQRSNYCAWEWRGEGPAPELPEWAFNRPSTTIVGSFKPEIVAAPGYRTTISRQNAPNSVRVTVQEAGILQSFPADYPWQGTKGKQFLQAGNAVPPGMAIHALSTASSIAIEREVEVA